MHIIKVTLTLLISCSVAYCLGQQKPGELDCSIFKSGKFKYLDADDPTAYIVMKGNKQTEYSGLHKYIIQSKIEWTNDCSYNMTMTKITMPKFPYKPGDMMTVVITKIEGDIIYYTSTVKGQSWQGRFRKLED